MRTTVIVPLLFVLAACAVTELPTKTDAELPSDEAFQGASVILVDVSGSLADVRERIVQSLVVEGYEVTQSTTNAPVIETEPHTFGSGSPGSARYHFVMPESEGEPVRIYGRMINESAGDRNSFLQFPSSPVTPGGKRLSLSWNSWMAMNDLANIIGGNLMYDRR